MRSELKKLSQHVSLLEAPEYTFPYCNTILVEDDLCCLIDTSVTDDAFRYLRNRHLDLIISTHYHVDHNMHNNHLPQAKIMAHEADFPYLGSRERFITTLGAQYFGEDLTRYLKLDRLRYEFREPHETMIDGKVIELGHTRIEVLHLPGHTPGHCGFLFPDLGMVFSTDLDLARFGPWYGNALSNVNDFIQSIDRVIQMKPEMLITSHTAGPITANIQARLTRFRDVIYQREKGVIEALYRGKHTLWEIVDENIIYRKFYEPQMRYFEWFMIRQHVQRLEMLGKVFCDNDRYFLYDGVRPSNINLA
ncbi:MAG: MBL fold metallo-hydrolase [Syntrophomonadales bacterium]|jgi:glyoxylase-like metal-dependent hydrolase (beta-lactamase superfamily II)